MSRDQGPQDTLTTKNGGNTVINGDCLPQPNDNSDLTPFDKISAALFWVGTTALVIVLVSLLASLTIFFFS